MGTSREAAVTEQERQFLRDMLLQVAREIPNVSCPDCLTELYEYRNALQAMLQQPALLPSPTVGDVHRE